MAGGMIAMDVLTVILAALLYGASARAAVESFRRTEPLLGTLVAAVISVLTFLLSLLVLVALLHRVFPKPTAGRHKMMKGAAFWGWTLNFLLKRVVYFPPLRSVLYSSNVLRFLSLRALGCDVAFTASMSIDADVMDPSLTTIGPGATLGARTLVASHYFEGNELNLAPVTIGKDVLLGLDTAIGPGCVLRDGSRILGRTTLSVFCTVGEGARINPGCYLDAKVTIEPGEIVPARSYRSRKDKSKAAESA